MLFIHVIHKVYGENTDITDVIVPNNKIIKMNIKYLLILYFCISIFSSNIIMAKETKLIRLNKNIHELDVYTLEGSLNNLGKIIQIKKLQNKTLRLVTSPKPRFNWVYEIEVFDEEGQYIDHYFTSKSNLKNHFKVISSKRVVEDLDELNIESKSFGVVDQEKCIETDIKNIKLKSAGWNKKTEVKLTNNPSSINFTQKEISCFDDTLSKKSDVYKHFYKGINKGLKETSFDLNNILGNSSGDKILSDPISSCVHASIKARGKAFLYKKGPKSKRVVSHSKYHICRKYNDATSKDKRKRQGPCASPEIVSVIAGQLKLASNCIASVYNVKPSQLLSEVIPLFNHESHFGINTFSHSYAGGIGQLTGGGIAGAIEHVDRKKTKFLKNPNCAPFKDIIENGWNKNEKKYFCNRIRPPKQPKKNIFSSIALYLGNKKRYLPNVDHISKMLRTNSYDQKEKLVEAIKQEMAEAYYNGGLKYPNKALSKLYSNYLTRIDGRVGDLSAYKMKTKEEIVEKLRALIKKEATDMIKSSEKKFDPDNTLDTNRKCPKARAKSHACYKKRSSAILKFYNANVNEARSNYYESQKLKEKEKDKSLRSYFKKQEKKALKELKRHKRIRAQYNSAVHMLETSNYARAIDKDLLKLNNNANKENKQGGISCGV